MIVNLSYVFLAFTLCVCLSNAEQFQIPPFTDFQDKNIRLNEIQYLTQPKIELNKIYRRQVYEVLKVPDNSSSSMITKCDMCSESPPQISFKNVGYYHLQPMTNPYLKNQTVTNSTVTFKTERIIYDYEVLKRKNKYQNIVDMAYYDNHIFTISSTAQINIYKINPYDDNEIELKASVRGIDWESLNKKRFEEWKKAEEDQKKRVNNQSNQNLLGNNVDKKNGSQYYTGPPPQPLNPHISKGYLQFLDNKSLLIFSNNQYLICMDVKTFKTTLLSQQIQYELLFTNTQKQPSKDPPLLGLKPPVLRQYNRMQFFQQIAKIDETHFAVVDKKQGIYIYEIIKKNLSNTSNQQTIFIQITEFLDKQSFGDIFEANQEMNLVDIEFNINKSLLIVLDYEKGLFAFQIDYVQVQKQKYMDMDITLSSYTILKKMCNLMQFSQKSQSLYLSCNKIYRISLKKWPKIQEKTFPHPLINIRQIYIQEQKDIFILAGYSVFKVMYLDRTTNYFQDDMLDKIIFQENIAITANENHIIALKYWIDKPEIVCQINNRSKLGIHSVMLRTTADCSNEYLNEISYKKPSNQAFSSEDICVYTVYKNIYVWQQGQIPMKPVAIVLLIFIIFLVVMIIWFVLVKLRIQRAQQHLQYLSEQGHKVLVQQEIKSEDYQKSVSENQNQQNHDLQSLESDKPHNIEMKKTQQQEPNKHLYSIE